MALPAMSSAPPAAVSAVTRCVSQTRQGPSARPSNQTPLEGSAEPEAQAAARHSAQQVAPWPRVTATAPEVLRPLAPLTWRSARGCWGCWVSKAATLTTSQLNWPPWGAGRGQCGDGSAAEPAAGRPQV